MTDYEYFLKENMLPYINEWIAIVNEKIVSHGNNAKRVYEEAKNKYPALTPLLTKIPSKQAMIL